MALWLKARPGPTHEIDALSWLEGQGATGRIQAALRPVLLKLWLAAYEAGAKAAGEAAGDFRHIPGQVAADRVSRMAAKWLREVTDTRIRRIAAILAQGGTAAELEASIKAMLASLEDAGLVANTEIMRALNAGAADVYRAARVEKVRWVTRSGHPCPICLANEAAGPRYLGEAFPSGDTMPPAHPHCECALVPAGEE